MKHESVPQSVRRVVLVAITIATLAIAAVSYAGISGDIDESVSKDYSSLYLAGPVTDDGGGG